MKQRLLAGLLAVVLVLGLAPAALAAAPAEEEAAQVLAALDIMVGDESGNLNLGATVTRAEFTKLAVAASTSRDAVGDTVSVKPYPDVPQSHWAAPYIKAAVDLGLVQGDLHGNFNPGRSITLAEGVTIVLRLLGYQDSDFTGVWPSGQMAQYRALKLNEGVTAGQDSAMTRRDALYLFYNLMITKNKEGSYLLPGAQALCRALAPRCTLAIVTNGVARAQRRRFEASPLNGLIPWLFISEELGASKPDPAFFAPVLRTLGNPDPRRVLMVGDNLLADIQGGIQAGLDTAWYNPGRLPGDPAIVPTWEVDGYAALQALILKEEKNNI